MASQTLSRRAKINVDRQLSFPSDTTNNARDSATTTEISTSSPQAELPKQHSHSQVTVAAASLTLTPISIIVISSLIFGGCCSNVFTLETIVTEVPNSGSLFTFVQFLFVSVTSYFSQVDLSRPPFYLAKRHVPLKRWAVSVALFFAINNINNYVFRYRISVPIHIIFRSGGGVTTMIGGYLMGRKYTRLQVLSVMLLTIGVVIAAWGDVTSKNSHPTPKLNETTSTPRSTFATSNLISDTTVGLLLLTAAQILSTVMGIYSDETYRIYGAHWKEGLFYMHILALPLFLPLYPALKSQFLELADSSPFTVNLVRNGAWDFSNSIESRGEFVTPFPRLLVYLFANTFTQYICIRGVSLLAAVSSSLTVTIVLNIRKLVSLLLSVVLFGNQLAKQTLVGACLVFLAGGLYSYASSLGSWTKAQHTKENRKTHVA